MYNIISDLLLHAHIRNIFLCRNFPVNLSDGTRKAQTSTNRFNKSAEANIYMYNWESNKFTYL